MLLRIRRCGNASEHCGDHCLIVECKIREVNISCL
jgi:hypothetical protein